MMRIASIWHPILLVFNNEYCDSNLQESGEE